MGYIYKIYLFDFLFAVLEELAKAENHFYNINDSIPI